MPLDLPIPACPTCNSREWRMDSGVSCANHHPFHRGMALPSYHNDSRDFILNAGMVHLVASHAAHAELEMKHALLTAKYAELAAKYDALAAKLGASTATTAQPGKGESPESSDTSDAGQRDEEAPSQFYIAVQSALRHWAPL